ncbi:MAG: septum site-determining protein MinC [Pseudomonadota bacterium]|nr:septum site-determining protein MinC [Pseudomonadota bacterium]
MPRTSAAAKSAETTLPFQIRGSAFTVIVLKVLDPEDPSFFPQLAIKTRQAPAFFHNASVVIDLEDVKTGMGVPELSSFVSRLKHCHLVPIGVQGASAAIQKAALAIGLGIMSQGRPARETAPAQTQAQADAPPAARDPAPASGTLVITEPVRSGQQVYASGGDLIILAPVSPGAELLADGHIHIYGPLRGRALAGLGGNQNAMIFCSSLEAELVSVAGVYRISEDIEKNLWKKSVRISLDNGYLRIDPLT